MDSSPPPIRSDLHCATCGAGAETVHACNCAGAPPAAEPVPADPIFEALWDLVAAMSNEGIPQTPRTKAAFKVANEACLTRLRSNWKQSSVQHVDDLNDPILRALANPGPGACPYCLMKNGLHASGCDMAPDEAERAISREAVFHTGGGWVYHNPDVGLEYSPNHPVASGEVPDATDVRASTEFEDWLVRETVAGRPPPPSREELIEIIMRETTDAVTADGLFVGGPNILVQGCKFVRGHARGYDKPEEAARKFAGFIADAVLTDLCVRAPISNGAAARHLAALHALDSYGVNHTSKFVQRVVADALKDQETTPHG